jgi:type IV pilus assembly protein PilC
MGRYCRALGRLLSRRVPVDAAILLAGGAVNTAVVKQLAGVMAGSVRQGNSLSDAMKDTRMFSSTMIWVVQKSEERGDAPEALDGLADFYEQKLDDTRDMLNVTIEPVLLLILGFILGVCIISLYLPLFQIPGIIR